MRAEAQWEGTPQLLSVCVVLAPRAEGSLREKCFERAEFHQIHISAPGILLSTQSLLPPGSPFLGIFLNTKTKVGLVLEKEISPGAHFLVKSLTLEADRSGFQLQLFSS